MQFNNAGLTIVIILFGLTIIGFKIAINYYANNDPTYKDKNPKNKTLKSLFTRLIAYFVMYVLSITLALIFVSDPSLRLLVLLLLTFATVGRCVHMMCGYTPLLEAWGKKHVK